MNISKHITNGEPDKADKDALVAGLLEHHASSGHPRKTDTYSIFYRDENDSPIAGIIVSFLWDGMHIDSLWVDKDHRGKGLGRQLLQEAESEAIERGIKTAYTDTFTWQALEFYRKQGYSEYGVLEDFPEGFSLTYVMKRL